MKKSGGVSRALCAFPAGLLLCVGLAVASGCATSTATSRAGGSSWAEPSLDPVRIPELVVNPVGWEAAPEVVDLTPPPGDPIVDELLASPVMRDPDFQAAVAEWVEYWREAAAPWFPDFLRRMGHFEQTIDSAIASRGMPPSLRYLPLIESGYNPGARSHAAAVGMWQFMAGTARERGMEVGAFVDERRNPLKSTEAAVGFLGELREEFGSWFLALAAYNGGPNRARRILRRQAPIAKGSDSLFWELRGHWPRETRDFVPKLVGAVLVARHPERYGYDGIEPEPAFRFDVVTVPEATTFDVLADAAGVSVDEIRWLNPELYRGFTPPNRSTSVRVPEGRSGRFEAAYTMIPPGERMTVVEHAVERGETLSHIARRYGVSVSDLREANPDVRPRFLQIGDRVTVPILLARGGEPETP